MVFSFSAIGMPMNFHSCETMGIEEIYFGDADHCCMDEIEQKPSEMTCHKNSGASSTSFNQQSENDMSCEFSTKYVNVKAEKKLDQQQTIQLTPVLFLVLEIIFPNLENITSYFNKVSDTLFDPDYGRSLLSRIQSLLL